MSPVSRLNTFACVVVLGLALGFSVWVNVGRLHRVEYISSLPGRSEPVDGYSNTSATGYADGQRELIVPERNEGSFAWIEETQAMLSAGEWRVRHVGSDNAPYGRVTYSTSPYRWWLAVVAEFDHRFTGHPRGFSVERAALFADPLLHVLFLLAGTVFVAGRFGGTAASIFAAGVCTLYPFAASFIPGAPDHHALARLVAMASVLVVAVGIRGGQNLPRWFAASGILGGLAMWVDAPTEVPVLMGMALTGFLAVALHPKRTVTPLSTPSLGTAWRAWALGGSVTVLAAYLIEYAPDHLAGWRLQAVHPLYGIAWLGAGELLAIATRRLHAGAQPQPTAFWKNPALAWGLLCLGAIASVPVALNFSGSDSLFARTLLSFRLSSEPGAVVAENSLVWYSRDGFSAPLGATLLPFLLLGAVVWGMFRANSAPGIRGASLIAVGPVLVVGCVAAGQIGYWSLTGGLLLVALVAAIPQGIEAYSRRGYVVGALAVAGLVLAPGVLQLRPGKKPDATLALTAAEAQELIARHLAHWLAKHADEPGTVIYAPPHETTALSFFGGFRGIGTFAPENRAGFGVSLMIAAANTLEEAQALLETRGVRYLVIPSWDPFFDNFASLYLDKRFAARTSFLIGNLRRFNVPLWLRPVAYPMPEINGYEGQSVLVFEVVENQSPALAAARRAEYFVDTGRVDQAVAASEELRRFPGDLGALAERAEVATAREDAAGFAQILDLILERLANGGDRFLAWDRRVSLAVVLAQANKIDLAQAQVARCMEEATTTRLRALSSGSLYKLLVLGRALNKSFRDPALNALAMDLLPLELRSRL